MTTNLLKIARPEIITMKPYSSARSEQNQGSIWLDANENPWNLLKYNRYPEPQPAQLLKRLSALYKVSTNQVLMTRGIDEGIDLLIRVFCRPYKDSILLCPPTYGMYKIAATIQGINCIEVPLIKEQGFILDTSTILKRWKPESKIIFLCSPNNPTGNTLKSEDILLLCQKLQDKALIVIDEAYIEFSTLESITPHINKYPNLIVLRTLSKAYGLAGIRFGVVLANPTIINLLQKIVAPYPIPKPSETIILNRLSLKRCVLIIKHIKTIRDEREKLATYLMDQSFVQAVWPSQANFILFKTDNSTRIMNLCYKKGIILRDRSKEYSLENCLRISIGTPDDNQLLMEVLNNA